MDLDIELVFKLQSMLVFKLMELVLQVISKLELQWLELQPHLVIEDIL